MISSKRIFLGTIAILLFSCVLYVFFEYQRDTSLPSEFVRVEFKNKIVIAELVDTPAKRILGLSGREELPPETGMWFDFGSPVYPGIWMKEMKFPIDILWFDEGYHVVSFKENALPESYPESFEPSGLSRYVLEVPVGFVKENGIVSGDIVLVEKGG